jgi:hypothetical protein
MVMFSLYHAIARNAFGPNRSSSNPNKKTALTKGRLNRGATFIASLPVLLATSGVLAKLTAGKKRNHSMP